MRAGLSFLSHPAPRQRHYLYCLYVDEAAQDAIVARLNRIEARLAEQDARLTTLERRRGLEHLQTPVPPARVQPPAPVEAMKVLIPPPIQRIPTFISEPASVAPTARSADDAEYQIGARILPYTGAAVFIIGLALLVSLAIGRGFIKPTMLWWGVNLLSRAFITVGQVKRDEKEQFGQILTAIGSCGLYLNFAAGNVYQHLYEGETLVGLFFVHSLVNLGYALWRSSRAFLGLGLLGGLIAALMPLDKSNFGAHITLHFLILVPAVLIAAKNKWIDASTWIYAVGSAALIPVSVNVLTPDELRVPAILATAVLTICGYAWSFRKTEIDPESIFAPCALFASGLIGFLCLRNPVGAWSMVAYGAAIAAGATFFAKDKEVRERLLLAAVVIAATIAPFGYFRAETVQSLSPTTAIFIVLAAVFALISRRVAPKAFSILGVIELSIALLLYLFQFSERGILWTQEVFALVSSGAALAVVTWALVRAHQRNEALVLSASILGVPLVSRLAMLLLGTDGLGNSMPVAVAFGLMVASFACAVLVFLSRWESALVLLWTVFVLGLGTYGVLAFTEPPVLATELMLLFGFAAALGTTSHVSRLPIEHAPVPPISTVWVVVSSLGGLMAVRLADLLLSLPWVGLLRPAAVIVGLALVVATNAALSLRQKRSELAGVAGGFALGALAYYVIVLAEKPLPTAQDVLSICLLLASVVGASISLVRAYKTSSDEAGLGQYLLGGYVLLSVFGGLVIVRLFDVVLSLQSIGFQPQSAGIVGAAVVVGIASAIANATKRSEMAGIAGLYAVGAAVFYGAMMQEKHLPFGQDVLSVSLLIAAGVASAITLLRASFDEDSIFYGASTLVWALVSRLGYLVLTDANVEIKVNASVSIAWTFMATVLIVIGFTARIRQLRYMGLAVFACTLVKVLMVDLAALDPILRVIILLLLGGVMLGGGYWYIKVLKPAGEEAEDRRMGGPEVS